ncbi:MAG: hypothetical protein HY849_00790 [Nitrosomonadales bacterium]|nr:hypothetical protein [Nitrosomonadales bacterium]
MLRRKSCTLKPSAYDLFGEIPVTLDDIETWLDYIPRMKDATPSRRAWYAKNWNVVAKIKGAKKDGNWPPVRVWEYEELLELQQKLKR